MGRFGGFLVFGPLGGTAAAWTWSTWSAWRLGLEVPGGAYPWLWTAAETLGDSFVWYGNFNYNS